jgi:phospholipid/cholesterol/gamma-HCH transport system permease protein
MVILQPIGRTFLNFLEAAGRLVIFAGTGVSHCVRPPFYPRLVGRQMIEIGYYSLPVVGLTAIFTGMVLALQSYTGFARFSAESAIPNVVVVSITRELGPVLAGLMVAGRIAAAMAAEIGTMRVTEQIDALDTLATNPFKYLVAPRLIAGTCMLPLLVLVADSIGVFGGYVVSIFKLGFNPAAYVKNTVDFMETMDVVSGLVKASVFGFLITLMGCYHGYNSKGGAQGVGAATTNAVVSASILIFCFNYFITELFFPGPRCRPGRIGGRDRRLGHGQVGPAEVHPGPAVSGRGQHQGRWRGGYRPAGRRPGPGPAQVRHAVPERRALRLHDGLGERCLRPGPGPGHGAHRGPADRA